MTQTLPFLASGIICGVILFQSFLIAPSINKLINKKEAAVLLRYIWPKFFLLIGSISCLSLIVLFATNSSHLISFYCSGISFFLMATCFAVTPSINKAKDQEKNKLWSILHLSTVLMTLIVLGLNALVLFSWKFII